MISVDEEQLEVVEHKGSTICVAGPGSGKTRTLLAKAERLYEKNRDLICLTFTRAAAEELIDRMPGITASTIHSYCCRNVGWNGSYDRLLFDFQNRKYKDKYEYVCIDEVQDLTIEQMDVVLSIAGEKIFAIGDPYQSIYGFNGALGLEAIKMLKQWGCEEFTLHNNYRSEPKIVDFLNKIYARKLISKGFKTNGKTAILSRTNKLVKEVSTLLRGLGIAHTVRFGNASEGESKETNYGSGNLIVQTCHQSKGTEFDYILLYKWEQHRFLTDEEKNLFYVSVSRASHGFARIYNRHQLMEALKTVGHGEKTQSGNSQAS